MRPIPPTRLARAGAILAATTALALELLAMARPAAALGTWTILDHPTTRDLNKLSFIDNDRGWVAGDNGTILMTTNGGASWTTQTCPVTFDVIDIDMLDAQRGWALAQQWPNDTSFVYGTTILRTTDGGAVWAVQSTFDEQFLHALEFVDSTRGCIGGDQGKLYRTSNAGASWLPAFVDSALFAQWPVRDFEFYSPTYGVATGGFYDVTGIVWRTTDTGKTWTHKRVSGEPIWGTHFFDSLEVQCVGGDLDYGAGMVNSTNGAMSWEYTYLGIWGQASAVDYRTPTEGWAPLGFAGTYMYTLDAGRNWTALFTPDSTAMYDVVFTDAATGYMVGQAGTILKYTDATTGVGDASSSISHAALLPNQPNPFGLRTRLQFRVQRRAFVSLKVYDVVGREVATVVESELEPGDHWRDFDGAGLPAGVYYYRLSTGSYDETRKMTLIR
jgi:photosystem II stability/assembly factor-like uncharacterized protein